MTSNRLRRGVEDRGLVRCRAVAELRAQVAGWRSRGLTTGYVPTMGALHEGHMALVHSALEQCDRCIVSIFVNPLQFDRASDLKSYPRDPAQDERRLRKSGADLLFEPDSEEMYPDGFSTGVMVAGVSEGLCGAYRPGHFGGVATVVCKLLLQALPDFAYFGEKDYQQLLVVRRMVRDLDLPVSIRSVATVREGDGLALSSRNRALSPRQRATAPALYRVLSRVAGALAEGREEAAPWLAWGRQELDAAGFDKIDYLELRAAEDLKPLARADRPARVLAAAWLGTTRLIDNLPVPMQSRES